MNADGNMTLDDHEEFIKRLRAGQVTADAVRQTYRRFWASRRQIVAEIEARYSTEAIRRRLWLPVGNRKGALAKEYYDQLADQYTMACADAEIDPLGGLTLSDLREMRLAELTDDQIAAHADKLARRHAAAARAAE